MRKPMNMRRSYLLAAALLVSFVCTCVKCEEGKSHKGSPPPEEPPVSNISPECAAILLVGGGVLGSVAAASITSLFGTALCATGFCATGVQGGSIAALWQSTLPLIQSGSLFAQLQSIAMTAGGVGGGITGSSSVFLGAAVASTYLDEFCQMINEVEPNTAMGVAIQGNLEFYQQVSHTANVVAPYVTDAKNVASKAIMQASDAAAPYVTEAKNVASKTLTESWDWLSAAVEEGSKRLDQAAQEARARRVAREEKERNGGRNSVEL